jgi:phosphatidylinositol alpha-1,6-mannosyltransferase
VTDLLLARDFPPQGGGIARLLGEIAGASRPGTLVVSTGASDQPGSNDLTYLVDRLEYAGSRLSSVTGLWGWARRARALHRRHRFNFCWVGNLKPAGHVARYLDDGSGVPYCILVYGHDLLRLERQLDHPAKRWVAHRILARARGVVAISAWTADRYRGIAERLSVNTPVVVVCPGVDTERFRPRQGPAPWRANGGDHPVCLTVARLVPHKGIDTALAALAVLRQTGQRVRYLVAGEGPDRPRLERLAATAGLQAQVTWVGAVAESELPDLYRSADLYLGLSRQEGEMVEGFGLALLEAQASGLPIIAGRSGGTGDAVEHGVSGYLVPPDDVAAVAAVLGRCLEDPERTAGLGRAGRLRMQRQFEWDRVMGDLDQARAAFTGGTPPAGR